MAKIEKSLDVDVSASVAYNQWTRLEDFPKFMDGVEEVTQLDDARQHWVANIGGQSKEWDARVTENVADERIAWTTEEGTFTSGLVTFRPLDENKTRVVLEMDYDPEGVVEELGDKLGFVSRRVEGDLKRFKEFVESREKETGDRLPSRKDSATEGAGSATRLRRASR
jgi:uncharacterized membrane protein